MTVCVFGGAGFVGRHVLEAFHARNIDVVSFDVAAPPGLKVDLEHVDIADYDAVYAALERFRPEVVVNLAYRRESAPHEALKVNVVGMDNCFEAARRLGVARIVYASSNAVNGQQAVYGDVAISETDATAAEGQYGVHKVFNEWQAQDFREKHGMSVVGVRMPHVAGVGKTVGTRDHVDCITKPARGERVRFEYRDTMRCIIHANDVAEAVAQIALSAHPPKHAVYNTGGETLSLGDIAAIVREFVPDANISFDHEVGGAHRAGAYKFNNDRITTEFGVVYKAYRERIGEMISFVRKGAL
jgi:nucleoside-diphosphate-sugar epimerase